jgi:transcriptional regulator with XRE-family HTH domain
VGERANSAAGMPVGLAGRLREVRTLRGLSVRELARRAGCSASLLSQVERGVTTPSAGIVYALANELGISLDSLFGNDGLAGDMLPPMVDGRSEVPSRLAVVPPTQAVSHKPSVSWGRAEGPDGLGLVQRADSRSTIDLSSGVRWERLTPNHDGRVDFLDVVYQPGGQSTDNGQAVRHDGREYLRVLEGELVAVIGFDTLVLGEGDSLAFDPTTPHLYRNPTESIVRVLSIIVHDPPA